MKRSVSFSNAQIDAALHLAGWGVSKLATTSGVPESAIADLLAGRAVTPKVRILVEEALYERAFVKPCPETDKAGEGVRFRHPAAKRKAIIRSRASDDMVELESRVWLHRHWRNAG